MYKDTLSISYGWVNSKSATRFQWLSALPGSEAWDSSGKFAWNLRKKGSVPGNRDNFFKKATLIKFLSYELLKGFQTTSMQPEKLNSYVILSSFTFFSHSAQKNNGICQIIIINKLLSLFYYCNYLGL